MAEVTKTDLVKGRRLLGGAIAAPVILTMVPVLITVLVMILAITTPPAGIVALFVGGVAALIGLIVGLTLTAFFLKRRSVWTREMKERIAANGIKAEQIEWFKSELKSSEKRALKAVSARDLLLADAYRETLASRLTASRILQLSRKELSVAKRRQNAFKRSKSERAAEFQAEIDRDIEKLSKIGEESKLMLTEAEARLEMIEAVSARHGSIADSEIALKKLSARTAELPLALEAAKMSDEIKAELEREDLESE